MVQPIIPAGGTAGVTRSDYWNPLFLAGLQYYFNPNLSINLQYWYLPGYHRLSAAHFQVPDGNLFTLGIGYKFII